MSEPSLKIGLAGFGNVGAGVYKNLEKNRHLLRERTGSELEITKIAVRDPAKTRDYALPGGLVTTRLDDLVDDPDISIVVQEDTTEGLLFGFGWAITGACPGPLFAQIGTGFTVVIITLLSAVAGTWVYGYFREKLPH